VNDRVEWHVWSSGTETWERIEPSSDEVKTFVYLHSKTVNGRHVAICKDATSRFVAGFHPLP
jgi:hypothetical protein